MAEILAFPLARRRALIRKQAAWFGEQTARGAERNLGRQLEVQADALLRKGVDPDQVAREIAALEGAIRAEVWRLVLTPGGAA
jgi:hypothetical protein